MLQAIFICFYRKSKEIKGNCIKRALNHNMVETLLLKMINSFINALSPAKGNLGCTCINVTTLESSGV